MTTNPLRQVLSENIGKVLTPELAREAAPSGYAIEFDFDAVWAFVHRMLPGLARAEKMTAIGLRRHGELIAGVIYEVRGEPLRDALRHVWKAEAREA